MEMEVYFCSLRRNNTSRTPGHPTYRLQPRLIMENTVNYGTTSRFQKGVTVLSMIALTTTFGGIAAVLVGWAVAVLGDALK